MRDLINRVMDDPMEFVLVFIILTIPVSLIAPMFSESSVDRKARIFMECMNAKNVSEDVCMEVAKIERRDNNRP